MSISVIDTQEECTSDQLYEIDKITTVKCDNGSRWETLSSTLEGVKMQHMLIMSMIGKRNAKKKTN